MVLDEKIDSIHDFLVSKGMNFMGYVNEQELAEEIFPDIKDRIDNGEYELFAVIPTPLAREGSSRLLVTDSIKDTYSVYVKDVE